jgi:hypothetical protein
MASPTPVRYNEGMAWCDPVEDSEAWRRAGGRRRVLAAREHRAKLRTLALARILAESGRLGAALAGEYGIVPLRRIGRRMGVAQQTVWRYVKRLRASPYVWWELQNSDRAVFHLIGVGKFSYQTPTGHRPQRPYHVTCPGPRPRAAPVPWPLAAAPRLAQATAAPAAQPQPQAEAPTPTPPASCPEPPRAPAALPVVNENDT